MSKSNSIHYTNEELESRSKVLFNSEYVTNELNERNQQEWLKSVQGLGTRWLYHKSNMIKRKGVK